MHNEDNLKPFRTVEEAREAGRKGGKASGEARRRKKTMKDTAKMLLDMQLPKNARELKKRLAAMGISEEDLTYQTAVVAAVINQAMKGSTKAAAFLRDTAGENPLLTQEESETTLADAIEEAYRNRMGDSKDVE